MTRARASVVAVAMAMSAACSGSGTPPGGTAPTTSALPPEFADCPSVQGAGNAAVDYVDFIQAFGQNYVAGLASRPIAVRSHDLGRVLLRSRCAFSALNDRTHQNPGPARDGDTAFLRAGTPIHAINGWSSHCRLAARSTAAGEMVAYLALRPDTKVATPRPCAVQH